MKIYKEYRLIKELPGLPIGTKLHWDLWEERYTELFYIGSRDIPEVSYKKDFLDNHPEWFEPVGESKELYQKFPDDLEEHFYFGELRHTKICRFCFDAQEILESPLFKEGVISVFRKLYNLKLEKKLKENNL